MKKIPWVIYTYFLYLILFHSLSFGVALLFFNSFTFYLLVASFMGLFPVHHFFILHSKPRTQSPDHFSFFFLRLFFTPCRLFSLVLFIFTPFIRQAVSKDLTSSSKFSGSCVLTLQTLPRERR